VSEPRRDCPADALAAAGDQRVPALQSHALTPWDWLPFVSTARRDHFQHTRPVRVACAIVAALSCSLASDGQRVIQVQPSVDNAPHLPGDRARAVSVV
jgi:hypothetical protein